ncbi:MAG: dihydroorotase [Ramlibacter sp.]|jgi:dihydroorotase/N-acyl-D-amino-acid deacylase|nr:dihydroorotase [Ramlibacter sp.]
MYDTLITNGTVVDGSGQPQFRADVAIKDGRIAAIGHFAGAAAAKRIDASERVVAPGFIDSHCHSELSLVAQPTAESKSRQGVTTEILGNCGWSAYPLADATRDTITYFSRPIFGHPDVEWAWSDLAGYFNHLTERGVGVNVATLVGHGNVRAAVLGFEDRAPSAAELNQMKALMQQAMDQGALGISTGLCYPPGIYASTDELVELCGVVSRNRGLYATHLRNQVDGLVESVQEALDIGRRAEVPVLISHHKTCGKRNFGKVKETLAMLERARAAGLDTFSDIYPYIAGSSTIVVLLPPWVLAGGLDAMLTRLADPQARARIARDWEAGLPGWENRVAAVGWESVTVSHVVTERNGDLVGLTVVDGAAKRGKSIVDFFCDLLLEERGEVGQILVNSCEEDMLMVLTHPYSMVGSDGLDVGGKPHPRQYGTFPKILGEFVREKQVLSLESAIHKMTGYTAQTFGLPEIGLVREGYRADLIVFDPATVKDVATYGDSRRYPVGIDWVMVGGVPSVAEGHSTGDLNGRVLRKAN